MAKTPKSEALGSALRQARVAKGHKLREFAALIKRDAAVLSRWETGERIPKPEQVAQILAVLGVDGDSFDEIMTLVYGTGDPQWMATTLPEQRQQMTAFVEYEQNATMIVEVAPLMIPGLLQTKEYIRAIMTGGGVPSGDIATRIAVRLGRKDVITKPQPARLLALIGQAALYHEFGGKGAALAQLRHLVEVTQWPNIELRIVPFGVDWHPGLENMFVLMEAEDRSPAVFFETRRSMLWLYKDDDVSAYKRAVDMILRVAMSPRDSTRFIAELILRLEECNGAENLA